MRLEPLPDYLAGTWEFNKRSTKERRQQAQSVLPILREFAAWKE